MSTSTNPNAPDATTPEAPAPDPLPPPQPPIGTRGVVIGTVVLGVLLLLFAMWAEAAGRRVGAEARRLPQLVLLEPADGAVVGDAVGVVFETDVTLRSGPAGWEAPGGHHIHAAVDGLELMPGPGDITPLDGGRYRWLIRPLSPGTRELRLFWSDRNHREVAEATTPTIRIEVR